MQEANVLFEEARKYRQKDIANPMPCTKEKRPVGTWSEFQDSLVPEPELRERLRDNRTWGLGILCGKGSGNLEVIDIDVKYDLHKNDPDPDRTLGMRFFNIIADHDKALFNKLRIIETPTHGFHLYYRCETIEGNQKLARRPATTEELAIKPDERVKVLIETRGLGGFIVAPPTPGYTVSQPNDIPTITPEQRAFLLDAARSLNEFYEEYQPRAAQQFNGHSPYELAPWDDYNERGDIISLLENHGWKTDSRFRSNDRVYLTRPGKNKGISADYHKEKRLFKCWSTSQGEFDAEKAYNHTAVYAMLECNKDFSRATAQLERTGYGKRAERSFASSDYEVHGKTCPSRDVGNPDGSQAQPPKTLADFDHLLITREKDIPKEETAITIGEAAFAAPHNISMISAAPKGAKTAINNVMVSCSISEDGTADGFPDIKAKVNTEHQAVILFDTEQSEADQQYNVNTIVRRAGLEETPDFLRCYNIRQLDFRSYKATTDTICDLCSVQFGGIHSIYIDGGADYIASVNDEEQSTEIIQWFTHLSIKYNCPVIIVVHQNPGGEKERGHFGSTGQRKCYGLVAIVKEGDVFTLQPKMMRRAGNNDVARIQFSYSTAKGYHVQVDAPDKELAVAIKWRDKTRTTAIKVFPVGNSYSHKEAVGRIMDTTHKKLTAAKEMLNNMVGWDYVVKRDDGNYMLNMDKVGRVAEGQNDPNDLKSREGRIGSETSLAT